VVHQCKAAQSIQPKFAYLKLGPKTTFVNDILNHSGTMAIDIYWPSDYSAVIVEFLRSPRLCSVGHERWPANQ
jgi:hypothetical protein